MVSVHSGWRHHLLDGDHVAHMAAAAVLLSMVAQGTPMYRLSMVLLYYLFDGPGQSPVSRYRRGDAVKLVA